MMRHGGRELDGKPVYGDSCAPPGCWVGVIFELIERRCLRAGKDLQEVPEGLDFFDPAGHCAEDPRGNTGKG